MKKIPGSVVIKIVTLCALPAMICSVLLAETVVSESFDRRLSDDLWNSSAGVRVVDGRLLLNATGVASRFGSAVLASRKGDARLRFTEHPVEIKLTDTRLDGSGEVKPGDCIFMTILSSDGADETRSAGFLKIRISDDGYLVLSGPSLPGPGAGAGAEQKGESRLFIKKIVLPLEQLVLRVSSSGFLLDATDANGPVEGRGSWNGKFDLRPWAESSPFVIVKSVRRPAAGESTASIGGLEIRTITQ
jgi:hypothetical protein